MKTLLRWRGNFRDGSHTTNVADHESAPFLDHNIELQRGNRTHELHSPVGELDSAVHDDAPSDPNSFGRARPVDISNHSQTIWQRLFSRGDGREERQFRRLARTHDYKPYAKLTSTLRVLWRIALAAFVLLGIFQFATLVLGLLAAFWPETLDHAYKTWREQEALDDTSRWPTDYTADITPVACHSHNDYWRKIPLKSAIKAGCTGVEADVWLVDNDLYVGHKESALIPTRTLSTLYINPLLEMLNLQNSATTVPKPADTKDGIFDTDGSQTLVLLIDFKTRFEDLWPVVSSQLAPLREKHHLTYFNGTEVIQGPVTVVVTGNAPFDYVVSNMTFRDMFFDAPLDMLAALNTSKPTLSYDSSLELDYLSSINATTPSNDKDQNQGQGRSGHPPSNPAIFTHANSYYASVSFEASIGWPRPYLSSTQREKIAAQIAGAHAQGLKVRYWGTPNWPIGLRNYLWRELVKMGIDYLNVDDLQAATKDDWRSGHSIWDWSLWGGRDW